jgi:peptidoglycan/xylan/chitin deacetylase (PgdA/CDA1 family)
VATYSARVIAALRRAARRALRTTIVRRIALKTAAVRGHGLVLVFHRVTADDAPQGRLITSIREFEFRQQLEALLNAGVVVSLEDLLGSSFDRRRPRFALTFDDDWTTHYERVLPVLQDLGVTATFFLSGRALHGLGPLWFERLDSLVAAEGTRAVGRRLGMDIDDPERLALACENDLSLQERVNLLPDPGVRHLSSVQIRALADAGMTIGFHTLHHPRLSLLPDSALDDALVRGRGELEEAAGRPIRLFAYPHGKADVRVAQRLRRAGFVAAFTGRPRPVRPGDDPYLLGRWEPGPVAPDGFVARVAARVNGWSAA